MSGQSSSSSAAAANAAASASDRSVILEGGVFDCKMTLIVNCPTGTQASAGAAATAIPALDMEVFDVNVPQRQISCT